MNNSYNFPSACKKYLTETRNISAPLLDALEQQELIGYESDHMTVVMKDLDGNTVGIQERYITPKVIGGKELKSKTQAGSKVGYFYSTLDFSKPLIVTEGEIDWISIAHIPNTIGIQGVANLKKLIAGLIEKGASGIFLLLDNDDPANQSIGRLLQLSNEHLQIIFDSRNILQEHKDCNEFICAGGTIHAYEVFNAGKSLLDFKTLIESFYIEQNHNRIDHQKFAEYLVQRMHLASANDNLFFYDQGIWQILNNDKAMNMVLREMKKFFGSHKPILSKDHTQIFNFLVLESYNEFIQQNLIHHSEEEICLDDCIYNVVTEQTRAYTKEDYKFQKLPYSSDSLETKTNPTKWLNFLYEITEGISDQEEVIKFLQEYIGYLFVATAKNHRSILIYGSGANGKGVLLSVIKGILGVKNCSSVGLHDINKDQYRYNLMGKLCNIDSDMQQNTQLDSSIIKQLVSGESVSAKMLYKQPIEFVPYARLLVATNELPYLKTIDKSVLRRFVFLNLKQSFLGRENRNLVKELLAEKEQIFARAIQGLIRLLSGDDFIIPNSLKQETENFIKENDTIEIFLEENQLPEGKIYIGEIYDTYKRFTIQNGNKAISKQQFNKRIVGKGFEKIKDALGRFFRKA